MTESGKLETFASHAGQRKSKFQEISVAEKKTLISASKFTTVTGFRPIILNSLPKSGTLLLRNILMHFVGVDAISQKTLQSFEEIQYAIDRQYSVITAHMGRSIWMEHLFKKNNPSPRMIILIRHPIDNAYSLANHLIRDDQEGEISKALKMYEVADKEVVHHCIVGAKIGGHLLEDVTTRYMNYVSWLSFRDDFLLLKYEDLISMISNIADQRSERYFDQIFSYCGIERPSDWRDRIVTAANPDISWTAQKVSTDTDKYPNRLEVARTLNIFSPGLCRSLGYSDN